MGDQVSGRPLFMCSCGEGFDAKVWHCGVCNHHWPMHRTTCFNCHRGRRVGSKTAKAVAGVTIRNYIASLSGKSA